MTKKYTSSRKKKGAKRLKMAMSRRASSAALVGFQLFGPMVAKRPKHRPKRSVQSDREQFDVAARYLVDGLVDIDAVVKEFALTKGALALSLGFSEDTLQRFSRANAAKTQGRLRELLEIITRVEPWAGGRLQAMAWYRGQSIPALGDQTAEALVQQDEAALVRAYLDAYAAGAFA